MRAPNFINVISVHRNRIYIFVFIVCGAMVDTVVYYSTITSFYHIRTRERAKYESVLHCSKRISLKQYSRTFYSLLAFFSPLRSPEKYYATRKISARIICKTIE